MYITYVYNTHIYIYMYKICLGFEIYVLALSKALSTSATLLHLLDMIERDPALKGCIDLGFGMVRIPMDHPYERGTTLYAMGFLDARSTKR